MSFAPDDDPAAAAPGGASAWPPPVPLAPDPPPPARRPWSAWSEVRRDLPAAAGVLAVLALAGFPVGLLWWALAPRADFRITSTGPTPIGNPSDELLVSDDALFILMLAVVGLLAGVLVWSLLRRRRGVAMLVAVVLGTAATGVIAWQLGQLLGPRPSSAELAHVGARVTTGLTLNSIPAALAVGPFFAVLAYLLAALVTRRDDLGRPAGELPPAAAPDAAPAAFWTPVDAPASGSPQP